MAAEEEQSSSSQVEVAVASASSPEIFRTARTRAEKDRIQNITIEESFKGALYGLAAFTAFNWAMASYVPAWTRLHRTPRWIIGTAFPIVGFVINGEHAALAVEREYALKRSYVKDLEGLPGDVKSAMQAELKHESISFQDVKNYILDNRYKVIGLTWAGVVGSVLVSTWANKKMPVSQKIITARVAAQASALAGFVAFAAASAVPVSKETVVDKLNKQYYERMISAENSSEAARWAEKWHQELHRDHPEDVEARKLRIKERLEKQAAGKANQKALAEAH